MSDKRLANDDECWLVEAAIAALAGSRWVAWFSLVLTGICAFALVATDLQGLLPCIAASAVLVLGAIAAYLALRTAMDRVFFEALRLQVTSIGPALASFDVALITLRWLPAAKAGRVLVDRVAGVERLVRAQGIILLMQAMLVASMPWLR